MHSVMLDYSAKPTATGVSAQRCWGWLSGSVYTCFSLACHCFSHSQGRRGRQSHTGAVSQRQECCCHLLEWEIRDEASVGSNVTVHCGKLGVVTTSFCSCISPGKLCSGKSPRSETGVIYRVSSRPSARTGSIPTFDFQRVFFQVRF